MSEAMKEYSLEELVDHPGLALVLTRGSLERRCVELMLDARSCNRSGADHSGDRGVDHSI
jgi:hypothetical protein